MNLLISNAALGFISLALTFVFCFVSVHITKFFQKKEKQKPPEPPPKEPPQPEPVYYIVERKRKRSKDDYSAPKRIRFQ